MYDTRLQRKAANSFIELGCVVVDEVSQRRPRHRSGTGCRSAHVVNSTPGAGRRSAIAVGCCEQRTSARLPVVTLARSQAQQFRDDRAGSPARRCTRDLTRSHAAGSVTRKTTKNEIAGVLSNRCLQAACSTLQQRSSSRSSIVRQGFTVRRGKPRKLPFITAVFAAAWRTHGATSAHGSAPSSANDAHRTPDPTCRTE